MDPRWTARPALVGPGRLGAVWVLASVFAACGGSPAEVEEDVAVTGVSVSATPNPVTLDATVEVSAAVQPADAPQGVTWTSDDTDVATVDGAGTVTLHTRGTVTITATSTADPSKSGAVTLEVLCPAPRMVSANPSADTTWENWVPGADCFDYVVQRDLTLQGELLTIEPGTVVGFEEDLGLRIRIDAGISAEGTAAEPIVLTGAEPDGATWTRTQTRGFWKGLSVDNTDHPSNALVHTTIEYTSGFTVADPAGLTLVDQAVVRIESTTSRQSEGYGISIDFQGDVTGGDGNAFTENALGPAWVYATEVPHLAGALLTGNDVDEVVVRPIAIDASSSWPAATYRVIYYTTQAMTVTGGVLTIAPGSTLRFEPDQSMVVATGAAISAAGTAGQPIVFTSTDPTPGSWGGIGLLSSNEEANRFDHVTIEYGGGLVIGGTQSELANLVLTHSGAGVRAHITNTTLRAGAGYGLFVRVGTTLDDFANNVLTGNASGAAYVHAPVVDQILDTNSFTGNAEDEIAVRIGPGMDITEAATWRDLGVPYHLVSVVGLQTVVSAPLTILPGVDILVGPDIGISLQGAGYLQAEGQSDNRISMEAKTAAWQGIEFLNTNGSLDYVDIVDAGSIGWGQAEAPGALTLVATAAAESSIVTVTGSVTFSVPNYSIVFTHGNTIVPGCPGNVYIPPPDAQADHCVLPGQ